MGKQKRQVGKIMCNDNGDTFITTLHNVILATDLCNRIFYINFLMDFGHTCLYRKWFCIVYFRIKDKNKVILLHSAPRKHVFLGEIKEMSKTKKIPSRKKIVL